MPKSRTTCTRCSMRRQRCDRKQPCSRCLQANEASGCTRTWHGGYNPSIHRSYPTATHAATSSPHFRPSTGTTRRSSTTEPLSAESTARSVASPRPFLPANPSGRPVDLAILREHELHYLQSCLPSHTLIWQLVEYHENYILWNHNCVHGPTFRNDVLAVLQSVSEGGMALKDLDLRWCALLFAVLSVALTYASHDKAQQWGITIEDKRLYSEKWHQASMQCLNLAKFASRPHVYSIQTIQIIAHASLFLGLSNQQFVHFGMALQMALGLRLHCIPRDREDGSADSSEPVMIHRETCRRLWWNLTLQDWFSISTFDMFTIHPQHFSTPRPRLHVQGGTDLARDDAIVSNTNHLLDAAQVMVDFHLANTACASDQEKYEQVLKHDAKLMQLDAQEVYPSSSQLHWIPWARRVSKICYAHKRLTLHRHFLGRSFRDPAFGYTRWASLEASRVILRETETYLTDPDAPGIWSIHSHVTGAGVTLCLDALHRSDTEPEHFEHLRLVEKALELLAAFKDSALASRGRRLLSSMLREGLRNPADKIASENRQNHANLQTPINNENETFPWPIGEQETLDALREDGSSHRATADGHPTPTSPVDLNPSAHGTGLVSRRGLDGSKGALQAEEFRVQATEPFAIHSMDDFWADGMLSELFPDQLGYGNPLAWDDLFNTNLFPPAT